MLKAFRSFTFARDIQFGGQIVTTLKERRSREHMRLVDRDANEKRNGGYQKDREDKEASHF